MFDQVAPAYDRTNFILTVGNEKLWRIATTKAINPRPGQHILDLAAGTGASSIVLAQHGAEVTAADFSVGMIAEGRRRYPNVANLQFAQADAMNLPFDDNTFDTVTISYGLRNVNDPRRALAEMLRVTKPGGRIVIAEFSQPPAKFFAWFYRVYNAHVLPRIAKLISSNADAYEYLNESIADWPNQPTLAMWLRTAGWRDVAWRNLSFGIVALHRATKPLVENAAPDASDER